MSRRTAVLTGIVLSVLSLGIGRAVWVTARSTGLTGTQSSIDVIGSAAAPTTIALAVVALAASLASTIASPIIRWVTGPVIALAGIGLGISATTVLLHPARAATPGVAEATGVRGGTADATSSCWPAISLAPALALVLLGVLIVLHGARWSTGSRYRRDADEDSDATRRPSPEIDQDPAALWDALSRGDDPTDDAPGHPEQRGT